MKLTKLITSLLALATSSTLFADIPVLGVHGVVHGSGVSWFSLSPAVWAVGIVLFAATIFYRLKRAK